MAQSTMKRFPLLAEEWNYQWGLVLKGFERVWRATGDETYSAYIQHNIDHFVQPDGTIRGYRLDEYNIDRLNTGKILFSLYERTRDPKYKIALDTLREQLKTHPRNKAGGLWHKQIYPYQMWLDGLYMGAAFYAQYAHAFNEPQAFDDIAYQFILLEQHTRDPRTGLLYHAWDESKEQRWANPVTGCSPHFWGRAIGWYVMAIMDVMDFMPPAHPKRETLLAIFKRAIEAVIQVQDTASGVWYQVLDQGSREGNYLESSASCMFVYALAKGVRGKYLAESYRAVAQRAFDGVLKQFIDVDENKEVHLHKTCRSAGLGNVPYRDGSFEYYMSEPIVRDNHHGTGAFILASAEIESL
jgi:unsaturated rhamnogalacturonyl hydrolase